MGGVWDPQPEKFVVCVCEHVHIIVNAFMCACVWVWVCVHTPTLFIEVGRRDTYLSIQITDEVLKGSCWEQWLLTPFIIDDTNWASFEFQNGKLQSPSICSVPHKTTSKPFPRIFQSPFLEVSFSRLTTSLLWKWYCWSQDVCSTSSAHCFGFQRRTDYLDCLSPSCPFIFPEISPPCYGDLKIAVCLIYPCPGLKHQ